MNINRVLVSRNTRVRRAPVLESWSREEPMGRVGALAAVVALAVAGTTGAGDEKPKKPHLELRASPRMAFSPVNVLLTAELIGGDDVEEYHCPELEWDWDDGGKSVHEGDCDPFEPGKTTIERRFTADHEYQKAG